MTGLCPIPIDSHHDVDRSVSSSSPTRTPGMPSLISCCRMYIVKETPFLEIFGSRFSQISPDLILLKCHCAAIDSLEPEYQDVITLLKETESHAFKLSPLPKRGSHQIISAFKPLLHEITYSTRGLSGKRHEVVSLDEFVSATCLLSSRQTMKRPASLNKPELCYGKKLNFRALMIRYRSLVQESFIDVLFTSTRFSKHPHYP